MKYSLLDNLTCPACKFFSLDLKIYKQVEKKTSRRDKCNKYCSLNRSNVSEHETYPCIGCHSKSILEGVLTCRECGTEYLIKNSIPCMLKEENTSRYEQWDVLYKNPDIGYIKNSLQRLLQQKTALITYYALVNTVNNNKLKSIKSIEVGCGSGAYSLMLKKMDLIQEPYLIDISPQALHLASNLFDEFNEECHLVLTDGNALPFRDKSFDLSLSGGVIEHFKGAEQQNMISEHCRVAKNVAIQVPASTISYWTMRIIITILNKGWPFGQEYPMHMKDLKELISREGYVVADTSYHDLLTASLFVLSGKYGWIHPLEKKTWVNKLFKHEIIVLAKINNNR
jgi:ubiquinone/menaquinone biosynthesis C-methylase UbiE/uncharacterized protein YbaR (Trm112 family)